MEATALVCTEVQKFSLEKVILAEPGPGDLVIRNLYSGVSIGTEFALVQNKISWGPYPLCTGYQGVGVVEKVGGRTEGFAVGDKVYFRKNTQDMKLADHTKVSSVCGTHASHMVMDPTGTHGAAILPAGVDEQAASLFVLPAVSLNGVNMASPRMGEVVLVYGVGLIGLGVVAAAVLRGCVVIAADLDDQRLRVARELGADVIVNSGKQDLEAALRKIAPDGADAVFECTGIPACLEPAIKLCRMRGTFTWQGNYGDKPFPFAAIPPHAKQLTMYCPCDDGYQPSRQAVMKQMALGALAWEKTITHRLPATEAPALCEAINTRQAPDVLGAVIDWS